jgi:hypothetical protein
MAKAAVAKAATGSEKRQHPRFRVGVVLEMHTKGGVTKGVAGSIVDLSVGGMSFETPAELEEGSSIYLKVNLPLEIRGQVRHIRQVGSTHRYGVRFHKLDFGGGKDESPRPEKFIAARFHKQENK